MANRIAGNILIIDSAMGNSFALANDGTENQYRNFMVNAIGFWSASSTGALLLTGANTSIDIVFKHDFPTGALNTIDNPKWFSFGTAQEFDNLKAPVVTAGTAFLYLA